MKTAILALAIALLGIGALVFAVTLRWIRLVLESYRRQARQCRCGIVRTTPPVAELPAGTAGVSTSKSLPK